MKKHTRTTPVSSDDIVAAAVRFNADRSHSLGFLRRATKQRDSADGLLYRHGWATGFQDLIFQSDADAVKFLATVK